MRVSFEWLREFVPVDVTPEVVAERLTMAGLEVEDVEAWGKPYEQIVVGKIMDIMPHPHSGRLSVCQVAVGTEVLSIVCGAHNIAVGDRVPVALVGAALPNGLRIAAERVAGVASEGMLCSAAELGFTDTSEGILILPARAKPGEPLASLLELRDVALEVNITPNRPDCLSIFGIAREISALTGVPLKFPATQVPEHGEPIETLTSVTVEAPDFCPRYAARLITNVHIGPSPLWMQRRLLVCGIRSHSNVVDATNYLLLELGHPLHAFDFDTLTQGRIIVRTARPGEAIVTLDGLSRRLDPSVLVIADAERPVGIAGVMGGHHSEIREATSRIFLESAYFQPQSIRRTSKKLGLRTEASFRFERGADFDGLVHVLDRCAAVIAGMTGGTVAAGRIDVATRRYVPEKVAVRVARVNQILGVDLTSETIAEYCSRLQLPVVSKLNTQIDVEVPSFRRDLVREIDLIEEVGRLHSYQEIPTALPNIRLAPVPRSPQREASRRTLDVLLGCGYTQVIHESFMNEEDLDRLQLPADDPLRHTVPLRNPLSKEAGVLRTTLIPSLLRTVSLNVNRDSRDLMLCELSKVFRRQNGTLPQEPHMLTLAITGKQGGQHWAQPARPYDFFDLVGVVEMIIGQLRLPPCKVVAAPVPYCHPGKAALITLSDEPVGVVGEIHPTVLAAFDLNQPVTVAEIDFDRLIAQDAQPTLYQQVPRFPSVTRDLSLIVDQTVEAGQILHFIQGFRPDLLRQVGLFDVYAGKPVPSGKKSLTFALIYRADDRTLTDDEVNVIHGQMVEEVSARFGGQLRGQEG